MKRLRLLPGVVFGLLALSPMGVASAEDQPPPPQTEQTPPADRGRGPKNAEFRERMLEEFDKDGNGQLSDEERQALRETMRERREEMRERFGRGPDGPPPRGEGRGGPPRDFDRPPGPGGPEGRRGPGGPPEFDGPPRHGGRGPDGPGPDGRHHGGPPPKPIEGLFQWFDSNDDDQLSREEFGDLAKFVHHRRHQGPPGGPPGPGPGGREFDGRGPEGPPPPGEGFGRRGPRGRWWHEGRGPGGRPPRPEDGGPLHADGPPPHAEGPEAAPPDAAANVVE